MVSEAGGPFDRQTALCLCVVCKNIRLGVWQGWAERSWSRNVPFYFWSHPPPLTVGSCHSPPAPLPPAPRPQRGISADPEQVTCCLQALVFLLVKERKDSLACSTLSAQCSGRWGKMGKGAKMSLLSWAPPPGLGFLLTPPPPRPVTHLPPLQALRLCGPETGQHHGQRLPPLC